MASVDLSNVERHFDAFLRAQGTTISTMDRTYAQRFEAYSFLFVAKRIAASARNGRFVPPGREVHLKYSTRGRHENYTFFEFELGTPGRVFELRHNLNVRSYHAPKRSRAAFCLDLAIVEQGSVPKGQSIVNNACLVTFYECKCVFRST